MEMSLRIPNEVKESEFITLTPEWLKEKYKELNEKLFDGELGDCEMGIFTTGKGCNGGVLGWFKMTRIGLKAKRKNRRIFLPAFAGDIYVTRNIFVDVVKPKIELNGNYKWTEKAALSTLLHEMCHYYTMYDGYCPKQMHGIEFKNIAHIVSQRSDDLFTVERIASAEQMQEMELDSDIAARNKKKVDNKLKNAKLMFIYMPNKGEVRFIFAQNRTVADAIIARERRYNTTNEVIKTCDDDELKQYLYNAGYKNFMRKYRYWVISNKPEIMQKINQYELKTEYDFVQKDNLAIVTR